MEKNPFDFSGQANGFVNRRSTVQSCPPAREVAKAEEWRAVVGYESYYEVSNLGRVRRILKGGRRRTLRPGICRGYPSVGLCVDGLTRTDAVHRLVARAFIGPVTQGYEVDHVDGDRTNAAVANLEYVTPLENVRRALARRAASMETRLPRPFRPHKGFDPVPEEEKARLRAEGRAKWQAEVAARLATKEQP